MECYCVQTLTTTHSQFPVCLFLLQFLSPLLFQLLSLFFLSEPAGLELSTPTQSVTQKSITHQRIYLSTKFCLKDSLSPLLFLLLSPSLLLLFPLSLSLHFLLELAESGSLLFTATSLSFLHIYT